GPSLERGHPPNRPTGGPSPAFSRVSSWTVGWTVWTVGPFSWTVPRRPGPVRHEPRGWPEAGIRAKLDGRLDGFSRVWTVPKRDRPTLPRPHDLNFLWFRRRRKPTWTVWTVAAPRRETLRGDEPPHGRSRPPGCAGPCCAAARRPSRPAGPSRASAST